MLIALAGSEVLDAARAAAAPILEAKLRLASLPDDAKQDPLLINFAIEQASPPDLYRFASSAGKIGGDAIDKRIWECVLLRYRSAVAIALADQYRPLNRSSVHFEELARSAVDTLFSDGPPGVIPSPLSVARLIAASRPFHHIDAEGRLAEAWGLNGEYHRNPDHGPALIVHDVNYLRVSYYTHGRLHRPHTEGPAVEECHGETIVFFQYWDDGLLHRPTERGPAEMMHIGGLYWEEFSVHGVRHRPTAEGPAFSCYDETASPIMIRQEYATHGQSHRDPLDGPCEIIDNGDRLQLNYIAEGVQLYNASEVFPC